MTEQKGNTLELRQSFKILIFKIIGIEIFMVLFHWVFRKILLPFGVSEVILEMTWAHLVNISWIIIVLMGWANRYFIIKPQEISLIKGVFRKKHKNYDIRGIQSVHVYQGIFGRILNYGTIRLENPLIKNNVYIRDIPRPHYCANLIKENQNAFLAKNPMENILPQKG